MEGTIIVRSADFRGGFMESAVANYAQWFFAVLGGIGAIIIGWQKFLKIWDGDGRDRVRIGAEVDVVDLLRTELSRAVEQNRRLALEIEKVQALVIDLREEIARLHLRLSTFEPDTIIT